MSIKNEEIARWLIQTPITTTLHPSVLDLSDCWADSANLKAVIESCNNLCELNVVNCSLTVEHLLDVLIELRSLKKLSATISGSKDSLRLGLYPSIEKINLELRPERDGAELVVEFLKACPDAKYLHIMIVGKLPKKQVPADKLACGGESLSKYERVIITTDTRSRWTFSSAFNLIFKKETSQIHFEPRSFQQGRVFWYERRRTPRNPFRLEPEPGTLSSSYRTLDLSLNEIPDTFCQERMIGLQIRAHHQGKGIVMPRLEALSAVVELDFTQCHLMYSAESWRTLADSSPAVESLALPSCALLGMLPDQRLPSTNADIMKAIGSLKLKRLYVASSAPDCPNCPIGITGIFTEHLSDFQCLKELVLYEVCVSDDFFDRSHEPLSMRTVKLGVSHLPNMDGLARFLWLCKNLQNLKLEVPALRFDCEQLWCILSAIPLKQLCLSSSGVLLISPRTLRLHLSRLFKSLNVFHLHASYVWGAKEVGAALEKEACIANIVRKSCPVRSVLVAKKLMAGSENVHGLKFPGRRLCCMRSFIGEPRPIGWDCD